MNKSFEDVVYGGFVDDSRLSRTFFEITRRRWCGDDYTSRMQAVQNCM